VPPTGAAAKTSNLTSVPDEPELYKFLLELELYFNPTILIRSVDIFRNVAILSIKLVYKVVFDINYSVGIVKRKEILTTFVKRIIIPQFYSPVRTKKTVLFS
jgi:hypothetical protein